MSTANTAGSTAFPAWGLSETYDRYGNRTGQAVTAGSAFSSLLTINPANNQITSPAFTYDASGHVTAEPAPLSATYTYDGEECLTGYTGSADSATYTCDGNHLRVEKVDKGTNAVSTVYLYSGGKLIAEYDNGVAVNSPSREYIYGHQLNAIIVGSVGGAGGTITYLLRDHLSPRVYSNSSGTDIGDRGHYPFGEVWYNTYTGTSNWFFTSYERDQESQLDYALARSYSNSLGRFMSPDAVAGRAVNPQSWNRYVYVLDDPIDGTDPSGNCWPPSACGQSFISWVNGLQQRAQNWAIGTGNPALAAQVTYTTGVTATVVDGTTALLTNPGPTLASVLTVGSALGAVWDSGDPQAILLGAVQDGGKVGALALVMAAPLVSPVESAAATPELTAAPTPAAATPPPPSYVFYSGPYAEEAATQWSAANNGIMIQQTEFGQAINNGTMTDAEASTAFAQSASGTAQVFSTAPFTNFGNIWFNYELPELADNPAVPNLVFNPVPDLSGENLGWDLGSTDLLDLDFIDWDF